MIQLRADPKPFYEGMRKAAKAVKRFGEALERAERKQALSEGLTLGLWRRKNWEKQWEVV